MDTFEQWNIQHAIYHPKIKDLRKRWMRAKRELKKLRIVPPQDPNPKLEILVANMSVWFSKIRIRSTITAEFGVQPMPQSLTFDNLMFSASVQAEMQPMDTQEMRGKRAAHALFHRINDVEETQANIEKAVAAKMKQLLISANGMTCALQNDGIKAKAQAVDDAAGQIDQYDAILQTCPEDDELWQSANESKDMMQDSIYPDRLYMDAIEYNSKRITVLLAQLGVRVARQSVLWEYQRFFQNVLPTMEARQKNNRQRAVRILEEYESESEEQGADGEREAGGKTVLTDYYRHSTKTPLSGRVVERSAASASVESQEEVVDPQQKSIEEYFKIVCGE